MFTWLNQCRFDSRHTRAEGGRLSKYTSFNKINSFDHVDPLEALEIQNVIQWALLGSLMFGLGCSINMCICWPTHYTDQLTKTKYIHSEQREDDLPHTHTHSTVQSLLTNGTKPRVQELRSVSNRLLRSLTDRQIISAEETQQHTSVLNFTRLHFSDIRPQNQSHISQVYQWQ